MINFSIEEFHDNSDSDSSDGDVTAEIPLTEAPGELASEGRQRRPPMSKVDQDKLRKIFVDGNAEEWTKVTKRRNINALLESEDFKHLSRQQILRRHNLFAAEVILRNQYGTLFYKGTLGMISGDSHKGFFESNILKILQGTN